MHEFNCPVEKTMEIIGGKWKAIIVYYLQDGTMRFCELKRNIPSITQTMLTRQLRELESQGILIRKVYPQVPPRVEYSLTDRGMTLKPILEAMCRWAAESDGEC